MNLTREKIKSIVAKSLRYPSGDNCQPWTFVIKDQTLQIFHDPARGAHPLNPIGAASALSLGCLVEALSIAASEHALKVSATYHAFESTQKSLWATITFSENAADVVTPDPLIQVIEQRATDRRPFRNGELPIMKLKNAERILHAEHAQAFVHMLALAEVSAELQRYIIESEKVLTEHPTILPSVIEWVRYTDHQARATRDGLSLRNMGIKPWEVPALWLVKQFSLALIMIRPMMRAQQLARTAGQLQSSAGLVCVSVPRAHFAKIPDGGRLMYRCWLELTAAQFGVQPLTIGSTLVYCAELDLLKEDFTANQISFFKEGRAILAKAFNIPNDRTALWMIRTGAADPLPEPLRTLRKSVDDVLTFA